MMSVRVVLLLGTTLFGPVPPAPASTGNTFAMSVERFFASCRNSTSATRERGSETLGRDLSTSLGARPQGVNLGGASLAALGIGVWAISRGAVPNLTIAPRLYGGGAGLGFSLRW